MGRRGCAKVQLDSRVGVPPPAPPAIGDLELFHMGSQKAFLPRGAGVQKWSRLEGPMHPFIRLANRSEYSSCPDPVLGTAAATERNLNTSLALEACPV